jgi:hypothetical protein
MNTDPIPPNYRIIPEAELRANGVPPDTICKPKSESHNLWENWLMGSDVPDDELLAAYDFAAPEGGATICGNCSRSIFDCQCPRPQPVVSAQTPEGPWREMAVGEAVVFGDEWKAINSGKWNPVMLAPRIVERAGTFRTRRPLPQPETAQPVGGTPRVDANTYGGKGIIGAGYVSADFARTLETELNAANAEVERVTRELADATDILTTFCPECIEGSTPMFDGEGNETGSQTCECCGGSGTLKFPRIVEERRILAAKLAHLPADWSQDSSLETWFPYTAQELATLRAASEADKPDLAQALRLNAHLTDAEEQQTAKLKLMEAERDALRAQLLTSQQNAESDRRRLEADAARYDFLRNFRNFADVNTLLDAVEINTVDAAVDKAMKAALAQTGEGEQPPADQNAT